ncbi:MAG: UvrD-helicase domain-containing protein [Alphaproteobacteria bacterium]|nr:UvrD-helicase domain-containing protein [Alphaproteobacteria bacterium]
MAAINNPQALAANPNASCWVSASAGTGKTKVLIDRLLNLLLMGTAPESILCITFTKAAAIEMQNRLTAKLQEWAIFDEDSLQKDLQKLTNQPISKEALERAHQLLFHVIDTPGGIRIQTIHSFCQSLLQRFPLEAAIDPSFTLLEGDEVYDLLKKAYYQVLKTQDPELQGFLEHIATSMSDYHFEGLLKSIQSQRGQFGKLLATYQNLQDYKAALESFLKTTENIPSKDVKALQQAAKILFEQGKPELEEALSSDDYSHFFLTQDGQIRKKLVSKDIQTDFPDTYKTLEEEASRLFREKEQQKNQAIIHSTLAFMHLTEAIFQNYQTEKKQEGLLDFEDLIASTNALLGRPGISEWVFYKLDNALDHILIDEAQDTSPDQWMIISKLIESFLTPEKPYRTLFVVGDIKQSIYSFQGAEPLLFATLRHTFEEKTKALKQDWMNIELHTSFRTTPAILEIVDKTFNTCTSGIKFLSETILHTPYREDHPGVIELLPLVKGEEIDSKENSWPLPLFQQDSTSQHAELAKQITVKIKNLLESPEILPSTNARTKPGDILILVRKRSELVPALIQNLKHHHIPVAGADRLQISEHIAVMDLLALGKFLCLPQDDYSLACVLKSPLINNGYGISEEELFTLCHMRPGSLWQSLGEHAPKTQIFEKAYEFLKNLLSQIDLKSPHSLFHNVLRHTENQFIARLGSECQEVLEEFLNLAFLFGEKNPPTLQGFMNHIETTQSEIKRSPSGSKQNQVRIMTIHGAKGLQSPIVILADSTDQPSLQNENFLWHEDLFLLKPAQKKESTTIADLKASALKKLEEENNRLFYVALTRPEDRLYIAGIQKNKEENWYNTLKTILSPLALTTAEEGLVYQPIPSLIGNEVLLESETSIQTPKWLFEKPLLLPISLKEKQVKTEAMRRGDLIHKLFEILPTLSGDLKKSAERWIEKQKHKNVLKPDDLEKTLSILNHPEYAHFFKDDSLAEVAITHQNAQKRIDRLLVTKDTVIILDYKTTVNPPLSPEDVSKDYQVQLYEYADIMQKIYKNHQIRTFLLWTEGPHLMEIPYKGF